MEVIGGLPEQMGAPGQRWRYYDPRVLREAEMNPPLPADLRACLRNTAICQQWRSPGPNSRNFLGTYASTRRVAIVGA